MSGQTPDGFELARTTPTFDNENIPASPLAAHRVADANSTKATTRSVSPSMTTMRRRRSAQHFTSAASTTSHYYARSTIRDL